MLPFELTIIRGEPLVLIIKSVGLFVPKISEAVIVVFPPKFQLLVVVELAVPGTNFPFASTNNVRVFVPSPKLLIVT